MECWTQHKWKSEEAGFSQQDMENTLNMCCVFPKTFPGILLIHPAHKKNLVLGNISENYPLTITVNFFFSFFCIQFLWSIQTENILSLFFSLEMNKQCIHSSFSYAFHGCWGNKLTHTFFFFLPLPSEEWNLSRKRDWRKADSLLWCVFCSKTACSLAGVLWCFLRYIVLLSSWAHCPDENKDSTYYFFYNECSSP